MIKLESIHIEEFRGIKKLDIDFKSGNFAISGPNGSGKSGVIDAIEFGLTGQIGRLTGIGTGGLSVTDHGPHVDKAKFPDAAFVELNVFLPSIGKSVKINRKVSSPKKPKITPDEEDIKSILLDIANHPEITLSRREILRFILVEPSKRSDEIQTILKLDAIGQTRSAMSTANNKLKQTHKNTCTQMDTSLSTLQRHLQIATFLPEDILTSVNARRNIIGLPSIADLTGDTKLDSGLTNTTKSHAFNKLSALKDVQALINAKIEFKELGKTEAAAIFGNLVKLESDIALLTALQQCAFVEMGLELIDGTNCPLCDIAWESEDLLRKHLSIKISKSLEAQSIQESLLNNGAEISRKVIWIISLLNPVLNIAQELKENKFSFLVNRWVTNLETLTNKLQNISDIMTLKNRFEEEWMEVPEAFDEELKIFLKIVDEKPDQTSILDAQTFLTTAQLRLSDYREAVRKCKIDELSSNSANIAYETYCNIIDEELNTLYEEVQKDFCKFYQIINSDDESTFSAKLTPSEGSLGLDVNFYNRGLFPPGAYHSEGHQDGMGVCLYLALMKHLFGENFTFALFDDVVMSVDSGHRYQFCKLLKLNFPNTQFIITTHDRLWAEQMKSAGLVTGKTSIAFYSWTIDTGPLVESNDEIWKEISDALDKEKINSAAAALRHHLEYSSRHLADQLGATPQFRADGNYELGDLLPSVVSRMKDIYGKAISSAQSWDNLQAKEDASTKKDALAVAAHATNMEQWAVNKAVHYNAWANFGKNDFAPVVSTFRDLLSFFNCDTCNSWLYVAPRVNSEILRCSCNKVNWNLKQKSK